MDLASYDGDFMHSHNDYISQRWSLALYREHFFEEKIVCNACGMYEESTKSYKKLLKLQSSMWPSKPWPNSTTRVSQSHALTACLHPISCLQVLISGHILTSSTGFERKWPGFSFYADNVVHQLPPFQYVREYLIVTPSIWHSLAWNERLQWEADSSLTAQLL